MPIADTAGIKSIQRGTIVIPANQISASVTITAVDTSKTVIRHIGWECIDPTSSQAGVTRLWLNSSTSIGALRTTAATASPYASTTSYEVIEYL